MRAGWREFIKQRFRNPSNFFSVGIEFGVNDIHVSVLKESSDQFECVHYSTLPIADWYQHLNKMVGDLDLTNTPCHVVFSTAKYQLLQIDRPQVPDTELKQALKWAVKDQVVAQGDLVVDYVDLPAQTSGADKINVVALPESDVLEVCDGLQRTGLILQSIGAAELATCDLLEESNDAVMTLVQQAGYDLCLNIVKKGQLYFSRRLRGYENLSTFNEQELQMGVGDNLSVDIQRSMDYFESQLKQAPVKKILLGVETDILDSFASLMQQLTFMPVTSFKPGNITFINNGLSGQYLPSLGAAMAQTRQSGEG